MLLRDIAFITVRYLCKSSVDISREKYRRRYISVG